jgi:hypothetical protein
MIKKTKEILSKKLKEDRNIYEREPGADDD